VAEHQAAEASAIAETGPGQGLTDEDRELMRGVARYIDHTNRAALRLRADEASAVGAALSRHPGAPVGWLPIVVHAFAGHRLVDADLAQCRSVRRPDDRDSRAGGLRPGRVVGALDGRAGHLALNHPGVGAGQAFRVEPVQQPAHCLPPQGLSLVRGKHRPGGTGSGG
jgi:hypothetical protein